MAQRHGCTSSAGGARPRNGSSSSARCALSSSARAKSACRRCAGCLSSQEHQLVGVVTQPDKPVGRDQRIQAPPIKTALAGSRDPDPAAGRASSARKRSRKFARSHTDVIVVMAYGQILPRDVLEIPRIACLNLHASLLPRHRGAAPIQAAITVGDAKQASPSCTWMKGSILATFSRNPALDHRGRMRRADRCTIGSRQIAPAALAGALDAACNPGALRACPRTTPKRPTRRSWSANMAASTGRNRREAIERKIRAFDPWPGALTPFCATTPGASGS